LKKRNKEINSKYKQEKLANEEIKEKSPDKMKKSTKSPINEQTMAKLQEIMEEDQRANPDKLNLYKNVNDFNFNDPVIPDLDENEKSENQNFEKIENQEDDNILVHRPLKNFVWGLGQKTKQKKCM
jgi:hypothetical protein